MAMSDERQPTPDRSRDDDERPAHSEINPAARRDRPGAPAEEVEEHEQGDQAVPPTQTEPLDPLGPGGIGG